MRSLQCTIINLQLTIRRSIKIIYRIVYYTYDYAQFSNEEINTIDLYVSELNPISALTYVKDNTAPNRIKIIKDVRGCWSMLGFEGGVQLMPLTDGCITREIVKHEFGHAISFPHEQTRSDRDTYVTITDENNYQTVCPSIWAANWDIRNGDLLTDYDYTSITHYKIGTYIPICANDMQTYRINLNVNNTIPGVCETISSCITLVNSIKNEFSPLDKIGTKKLYGVKAHIDIRGFHNTSVTINTSNGLTCDSSCHFIFPFQEDIIITANVSNVIFGGCIKISPNKCRANISSNQSIVISNPSVVHAIAILNSTDVNNDLIFKNSFEL